jgi:hypothetical protein
MHLRWIRRQLKTNRQKGEFLCPHEEVARPWILSPRVVDRGLAVWNPGPTIRECCIDRGQGLALAAWWWEVRNRFDDLNKIGLEDSEITQALLEQLDYIESLLEEVVPKPTKDEWARYIDYRDDLGLTTRRVRVVTPACFKHLGLTWPCSKDELAARWKTITLRVHPDHGGKAEDFRFYLDAYKKARGIFDRLSA